MATTVTLKPNAIDISGSTSGTTTLQATAVAGTTTLTLPAATDTLVGKATTDTLTNKTLTGAAMNGTVGATTPSTGAFTTVQIGTNPAGVSIGVLGIPNQKRVYGRNAANSADVNILYVDGSNGLVLGPSDAAVINSSGNLGIGANISGSYKLEVNGNIVARRTNDNNPHFFSMSNSGSVCFLESINGLAASYLPINFKQTHTGTSQTSMVLDSSGTLLVGTTDGSFSAKGIGLFNNGQSNYIADGATVQFINRLTSDGILVSFNQAGTEEGSISVSGTTVSYNGGHLSRWAQTTAPKDDALVKGTVLSNLDAMNVYTDAKGNPVDNEQLNKVKVSDVEGDANVAGVFVNWGHDEDHNVDEINMAMTGDMIIRIAQGVTVARGDLLMSAGDGTAKPQGDDIVRSKTVAKVTSTYVTCTYADGSYCVPCVLMAC